MFSQLVSSDAGWTLTIARTVLRVIFFAHGAQNLLGWFGEARLKTTMHDMRKVLGLPALAALVMVLAEFLGGAGLIVGLFSRIAAIGLSAIMMAAILMVHGRMACSWIGLETGRATESNIICSRLRWRV